MWHTHTHLTPTHFTSTRITSTHVLPTHLVKENAGGVHFLENLFFKGYPSGGAIRCSFNTRFQARSGPKKKGRKKGKETTLQRNELNKQTWFVLSNIFYFSIHWEESSQLTHIFQRGMSTTNQKQWGFTISHLAYDHWWWLTSHW